MPVRRPSIVRRSQQVCLLWPAVQVRKQATREQRDGTISHIREDLQLAHHIHLEKESGMVYRVSLCQVLLQVIFPPMAAPAHL